MLSAKPMTRWNFLSSRSTITTLKIMALSGVVGAGIGVSRSTGDTLATDLLFGALIGLVIAAGCSISEFQLFSNPKLRATRRLRPIVLMALRGGVYSIVIVFGLSVPGLVSTAPLIWEDPAFVQVFVVSAFVAYAISFAFELTRLLGPEATKALIWGRYAQAQLENRVILFADVVGSTALAEKIGQLKFHDFLRDVAQDVAGPVEATAGEIHKYVGDAVIVTWPLEAGTKGDACYRCALGMIQALTDQKDYYKKTYGAEARLRIGIHCGEVAAGEIGDWKKEIALLGDPMNTTARIEGAAKALLVDIALSDDIAKKLSEKSRTELTKLPPFHASGKQQDLILWSASPTH